MYSTSNHERLTCSSHDRFFQISRVPLYTKVHLKISPDFLLSYRFSIMTRDHQVVALCLLRPLWILALDTFNAESTFLVHEVWSESLFFIYGVSYLSACSCFDSNSCCSVLPCDFNLWLIIDWENSICEYLEIIEKRMHSCKTNSMSHLSKRQQRQIIPSNNWHTNMLILLYFKQWLIQAES